MQRYQVHVGFSPEWQSWGVMQFNDQGIPIGESTWHHLKSQAVRDAPRVARELAEEHALHYTPEIRVFTKNWALQRVL